MWARSAVMLAELESCGARAIESLSAHQAHEKSHDWLPDNKPINKMERKVNTTQEAGYRIKYLSEGRIQHLVWSLIYFRSGLFCSMCSLSNEANSHARLISGFLSAVCLCEPSLSRLSSVAILTFVEAH